MNKHVAHFVRLFSDNDVTQEASGMNKFVIALIILALLGLAVVAYAHMADNAIAPGHGWGWCPANASGHHMAGFGHHGMHSHTNVPQHRFHRMHNGQTNDGDRPGWCWNQQPETSQNVR